MEVALLFVFVAMLYGIVRSWSFLVRQAKSFFFVPRRVSQTIDTSSEIRYQYVMMVAGSILLGMMVYFYRHIVLGYEEESGSQLPEIAVFAGISFVFLLLRLVLYSFVNWVFFSGEQGMRWRHTQLFLMSLLGVLLLPAVVAAVFFSISSEYLTLYCIFVLIFVELLTMYRCFVIFFKRSAFSLQIFLYFCALEFIPVVLLWTVFNVLARNLALNI